MHFNFIHQSQFCPEKLPFLLMETSPLWSDLWRRCTTRWHIKRDRGRWSWLCTVAFHFKVKHRSCRELQIRPFSRISLFLCSQLIDFVRILQNKLFFQLEKTLYFDYFSFFCNFTAPFHYILKANAVFFLFQYIYLITQVTRQIINTKSKYTVSNYFYIYLLDIGQKHPQIRWLEKCWIVDPIISLSFTCLSKFSGRSVIIIN